MKSGCVDLLHMFNPLALALNEMQKDETNLSKAVEIWLNLLEQFPKGAHRTILMEQSKPGLVSGPPKPNPAHDLPWNAPFSWSPTF